MKIQIEVAKTSDAGAMLEIYSPHVLDSAVSFETTVPTMREFEERIRDTLVKFPWLVCKIDGELVGYAYASAHRTRCAYDWSVEASVYVDSTRHRLGIASSLYSTLFQVLRKQGIINVYCGITLPNPASVAFHESIGFSKIGVYEKIGYKLGKWHDVGWWQLRLTNVDKPSQVIPFSNSRIQTELLPGLFNKRDNGEWFE